MYRMLPLRLACPSITPAHRGRFLIFRWRLGSRQLRERPAHPPAPVPLRAASRNLLVAFAPTYMSSPWLLQQRRVAPPPVNAAACTGRRLTFRAIDCEPVCLRRSDLAGELSAFPQAFSKSSSCVLRCNVPRCSGRRTSTRRTAGQQAIIATQGQQATPVNKRSNSLYCSHDLDGSLCMFG